MLKLLFLLLILMPTLFSASIFSQSPPLETGVSQTLAKWRAANYSDVRYKLNITLEKGAPLMKGEIEIRVNLTDEAAKNDLILDWRTTQFANDEDKPYANVATVNATGAQASPLALSAEREPAASNPNAAESDGRLRADALNASGTLALQSKEHLLIPAKYLKPGENVIKINFASPIKTSGSAITRYIDKEDGAEYIYSLFVPSDASTAFPVFDQPDLKARFRLTVQSAGNWRVISNTDASCGRMDPMALSTCYFKETKPISTYVFAFAAGDFAEMSVTPALAGVATTQSEKSALKDAPVKTPANAGVTDTAELPMKVYVRKSQAEKFKQHAAEVFRLNREGVKFLESYFDYKFPFPKYDLVLIPEFPFGGMEHAGATFLRESSVIFPSEPTKNDLVSRANVIFHEAAHQWFGDTVTMKWFDDLWLKEGFAEFMAYKTLEKVMPEYNAWKIFYERNKQAAYLTDSTKGTTPIYQEIPNLSAAKSAYGNIVYRKAPSFLKQAEFYLGEKEFQIAVRAFLKKHEFANAEWTDLVKEFELASKEDLKDWANVWVTERGMPLFRTFEIPPYKTIWGKRRSTGGYYLTQKPSLEDSAFWKEKTKVLIIYEDDSRQVQDLNISRTFEGVRLLDGKKIEISDGKVVQIIEVKQNLKSLVGLVNKAAFVFPNYQDYGYGIFLLDEKSRAYILTNIQTEKDDFIRAMMWGALWDSVREGELNPKDYVELVIKNINVETDESTIQTLLSRVSTAMNYYLSEPPALAGDAAADKKASPSTINPPANAVGSDKAELVRQLETLLIDKIQNAPTQGLRITFYRAFLNIASSQKARNFLYEILNEDLGVAGGNTKMRPGMIEDKQGNKIYASSPAIPLKPKDRADIIAKLLVMGDANALTLLKDYENSAYLDRERYAYAARAAIATGENKAKYWNDFLNDKNISENWIESALVSFNSSKQTDLTLPYLEKALTELPNLKKTRKIFFVNSWLSAFIGGQKSAEALKIVNDFLAKNSNLDKDLRLKILENADGLERAVKIRAKFGNN